MADQAVQTMLLPPSLPELPEPAFVTPDDNLYTVHQMRAYARAALAAPAASGVDTSTNEAWAARAQEKIATMDAAASVSERARDDRFTAMLIGIIADVQDALGFTDEDKECSNGSLEIVAAIRELKEQALTQQRGEREDAHKFRRLAQLLDGFDFRLGRNVLMPPATYLDSVEITCEFQPGIGQSVIDAIVDVLTTEKRND